MAHHKFHDVGQSPVGGIVLVCGFRDGSVALHGLVTQALQTAVADACQQIAFLCARHQRNVAAEQLLEDVADHILALLPVAEQGLRHPLHLGIVLSEQLLDYISFHHVSRFVVLL